MSFVPNSTPQSNAASSTTTAVVSGVAGAAAEVTDSDYIFKIRTFDVYWVERSALMYRDGIQKVSIQKFIL
jgi:hypothetical protein